MKQHALVLVFIDAEPYLQLLTTITVRLFTICDKVAFDCLHLEVMVTEKGYVMKLTDVGKFVIATTSLNAYVKQLNEYVYNKNHCSPDLAAVVCDFFDG